MFVQRFSKSFTAAAVFAAVVLAGILMVSKSGQAANDNNGAQDEKQMIQIGLAVAASNGITLNMNHKDQDMVGLGSYLVNVIGDCNGCHSAGPPTEFATGGNPYLLRGASPLFSGIKKNNAKTYLGGGRDFGAFPNPTALLHIISRNLTPDSTGRAEGGHTLSEFMLIMRTGIDLDKAHLNCAPGTNTATCLLPPNDGTLLQVMRWPSFQDMTDLQLTAMYDYLSAVPCLEGGPGEPANRCK
jgi:hypothetical protein